jgi:hypothetical protein
MSESEMHWECLSSSVRMQGSPWKGWFCGLQAYLFGAR